MPRYSFLIWNQQDRAKYPKSLDLADIDAARTVALRIARAFAEVVPYWDSLTEEQQNGFVVEIVDETGETVLTVPFREAEEPDR